MKPFDDEIFLTANRTDAELAALRSDRVAVLYTSPLIVIDAFTCDECDLARRCVFAFDHYNTDGDCLLEK